MIRTPAELSELTMCARCEARPGNPCVTVTGNVADFPHAIRMRVVFETQAEQYAEDVHFMAPDYKWHKPETCDWCKRAAR